MKRMTLPAILVAAVLAFSLSGCSQSQNITEDTLKGVWSLDSSSNLGFQAYVNFTDDNVAEMIIADSWLDGTWSISGSSATVTFEDEYAVEEEEESDSASASGSSSASSSSSAASSSSSAAAKATKLSYSNNKLTLGSDDGSKLVFVKDNSEEAKEMFSFDATGVDGMTDANGQPIEYVEEVINDIEPVTIADDDKFTITVTGKGTDYTADPCFRLSITNKTDKTVFIVPQDTFKVGGADIEAGFGDELEPGKTIETEMYFSQSDLGGGLEKLTTVDGVLEVIDDQTDQDIATYPFHME